MKRSHVVIAFLLTAALGAASLSLAQSGGSRSESRRDGVSTTHPSNHAPAATATSPASRPSWERYRVIVDRNIFVRDRTGRRTSDLFGPTPATSPATAPSTQPLFAPEGRQRYVVTGTVLVGAERLAFIEDSTTGATTRVRPGEQLGGATLRGVGVDHVIVEADGDRRRVAIGETLAGGASTLPAPTAGASSGAASSSEAAILERLRARREKEMSR